VDFVFAQITGQATSGYPVINKLPLVSKLFWLFYLPSLDLSINQAKQQTSTLHIGTHIFSETSKDNTQNPAQARYQLASHLQSNSLPW
jgi:hypothetical protein